MKNRIEEENDLLEPDVVTVQKTITLLRAPKATFVSLVPNGANQRPFRVVKSDHSRVILASGKQKKIRKIVGAVLSVVSKAVRRIGKGALGYPGAQISNRPTKPRKKPLDRL